MVEHFSQRTPEKIEVVHGQTRALRGIVCKSSGNKAVGAVQSVRQDVLPAHLSVLFLRILFVRDGATRDRDLNGSDGFDGTGKRQLNWAADLPGVDSRR